MSTTKLYNLSYCPFGQRAWASLLYKEVDFEYIEQDPYNKSPEWLAINPRGLVPAIVCQGKAPVYESSICIEYVDEMFQSGKPLLPREPDLRAKVRIWSDHISKKIVATMYAIMLKPTDEERDAAKESLLGAMEQLCEEMDNSGPFFLGKDFGMVDIMLAPFAFRLGIVTKHYRDFDIPAEERFKRYHTWWAAVKEVPCLKDTFPDKEKTIERAAKYAQGKATSETAKAILGGKSLP